MSQSVVAGDLYVAGNFFAQTMTLPAGSVSDANIPAGANVAGSKLIARRHAVHSDLSTANIAALRKVIHRCNATGGATILQFGVGAVTPFGAASTATVKLLKNGVDILSADIVLDSTTAAFVLKLAGGFTSAALVAGDVLEVQISAVTGANPAAGFFAQLILDEFPN